MRSEQTLFQKCKADQTTENVVFFRWTFSKRPRHYPSGTDTVKPRQQSKRVIHLNLMALIDGMIDPPYFSRLFVTCNRLCFILSAYHVSEFCFSLFQIL